MRSASKMLLAAIAVGTIGVSTFANAAFFGYPRNLNGDVQRIRFESPTLAPIAFSKFCLSYAGECKVRRPTFRPRPIALTEERWADLVRVNREVNRSIIPQRNEGGVLDETWKVNPKYGECNSYAVSKRHELLARGWPSRSLLLTEVALPSGEHHLVVVVRTREGDFVLDNLSANVRPVGQIPYRWVRSQSSKNPLYWSTVSILRLPKVAANVL